MSTPTDYAVSKAKKPTNLFLNDIQREEVICVRSFFFFFFFVRLTKKLLGQSDKKIERERKREEEREPLLLDLIK